MHVPKKKKKVLFHTNLEHARLSEKKKKKAEYILSSKVYIRCYLISRNVSFQKFAGGLVYLFEHRKWLILSTTVTNTYSDKTYVT